MVDLILPEDGAPGWGAIVRAAFDSLNAGKPDVTDFSDPGSAVRAALDGEFMTAGELVFNVRDYGAVADGVSDDQPGIQAAIAAAQAKGRGVVYIPAGVYRLGAALTISGHNISLVGQGRGLGLDIARRIVTLLGGSIEFDSTLGHTEFCVSLPVVAPATDGPVWGRFVCRACWHPFSCGDRGRVARFRAS